jgi:DNA polymerase
MKELRLDFESYSEADLRKVGLSRYARHYSTEVLMAAYQIDDGKVKLWDKTRDHRMPDDLREALEDEDCVIRAWNAQFEREILEHVLGFEIPVERFRCTMALSYSLSLPGGLGDCGAVIGLLQDKAKDRGGKALIKLFCTPRKPTKTKPHTRATRHTDPEKWAQFCAYCVQDVIAEGAIYTKLRKWDMSEAEIKTWQLDQTINRRGIPINVAMVRRAQKIVEWVIEDRIQKLKKITGLLNPNSTSQLLHWLRANGYPYEDLKRGHIDKARADKNLSREVRKVLEWRGEISKASVKKFKEILSSVDDDGFLRFCFQYCGASRTGRWGGRRFQPQNLPRPTKKYEAVQEETARLIEHMSLEDFLEYFSDPMDALSSCVRPVVQAPDGVFLDADLSAIENVVLGWVCGEDKILDTFRAGRDPYLDFAAQSTGIPYEELDAGKKDKYKKTRQDHKPAVLGCGYQLGAGEQFEDHRTGEITGSGLLGYALNMGISLSPEQSKELVTKWRDTYSEVVEYWKKIENAAKRCVQSGKPTRAKHIEFEMSGPFLRMILPSGRALHYCRPSVKLAKTKFGMKEQLTYWGVADNNKWCEIKTYGGKLVENCLAGDTRVVTNTGVKKLVDVRIHDTLWDGEKWVSHGGVKKMGEKPTVSFGGIRMTPDHKVLTGTGWKANELSSYEEAARESERLVRCSMRVSHRSILRGVERFEVVMGDFLRLRKQNNPAGVRVRQRETEIVRLHAGLFDSEISDISRKKPSPGVRSVAEHDSPMRKSEARSVPQLRGAGNFSLREMARVISEFLERYGRGILSRGHRPGKQQRGLLARKLSVGLPESEFTKQAKYDSPRRTFGESNSAVERGVEYQQVDPVLPGETRPVGEDAAATAGRNEPVYDIVNAGPDHRFTIVGNDGRHIIVHNCVQAIARDVLVVCLKRAEKKGLPIHLHVHDQLVALFADKLRMTYSEAQALLIECMRVPPKWAPDLPLNAAGNYGRYFVKD